MKSLKKRHLAAESLELRELLAVTAGGICGGSIETPLFAASFYAASDGTVFLSAEGDLPEAGAAGGNVKVVLNTSRPVQEDFQAFTLYVGIDDTAVAQVSASEFDPARTGVVLADSSLASVPDITVTTLLTKNLVKNGSYAVYLYAGGESAPVEGTWYLKVTWFNYAGDWTGGADTVDSGLDLLSIYIGFDQSLTGKTEAVLHFTGNGGDWWNVEETSWSVPVQPERSSDLIAEISGENLILQEGCFFFLSGTESYSLSGRDITGWFWDQSGSGLADAEGPEVWLSLNKTVFDEFDTGIVSLTVGDAFGNLSDSAEITVTREEVAPILGGKLEQVRDTPVILAELCYADAAGRAGAFWEIDWGDGQVDKIESLSFNLTAAHTYSDTSSHTVAARVTDAEGNQGDFTRIGVFER